MSKKPSSLDISELENLCKDLDPYREIPLAQKELLQKYGLDPDALDPFTLSNRLLQLLDQAQHPGSADYDRPN